VQGNTHLQCRTSLGDRRFPFHAAFGRSVATGLILLSLGELLGKMPHRTVGSQGLITGNISGALYVP
jgi:hypothetical protein